MNNLYPCYAVIFDMDGVVADTNPFHSLAWKAFAEKYKLSLNENDLKNHVFGRTNKNIFDFLFNKSLSEDRISELANEKEIIFRELFRTKIKPLPGLISLLEDLKSNSFKIGMATSAPEENVTLIVDVLKIRKYFDAIVDPKDIVQSKPDPEIYIKCSQLLSVLPERCLVFEDSLPGIQSAIAAGIKVIGVTTTHKRDELNNTVMTIKDFTEINVQFIKKVVAH